MVLLVMVVSETNISIDLLSPKSNAINDFGEKVLARLGANAGRKECSSRGPLNMYVECVANFFWW